MPTRVTAFPSTTPAAPRERALPRQAMAFFLVAPPIMALLFDPNCVKDAHHVVRAVLTLAVYTVVTGLGVHFSFEWVAHRLASVAWWWRLPAHVVVTCLVVGALTLVQFPFVELLYPEAVGELLAVFWRGLIVSSFYLAVAAFIASLMRQAVRERLRAHEERAAALEARLATLQAQLQPHFLFNSLNVCAGLVHEDPDAAEQTLDRLAGFLRYTLESTDQRTVPLEQELDAIGAYLEVQRQRFGDRLRVEFDVEPAARAWSLPPMILQPLVENAVLHGIHDRAEGGLVRVVAGARNGACTITVEDDGVGPGRARRSGTGTGLRNVTERLRITLGPDASLETGVSSLGGFAAILTLGPVT